METKAYDKNQDLDSQTTSNMDRQLPHEMLPPSQPPTYQQFAHQGQMPPPVYQEMTSTQPITMAPTYSQQPLNVANTMVLQPAPRLFTCPYCQAVGNTVMKREIGLKNHALAAICCMSGICMPCCWVAYLINEAKDSNHYCSSCGSLIGKEAILNYYQQPYHQHSGVMVSL